MKALSIQPLIFLFCYLLAGCTHLTQLQNYTKESLKGLGQFENLSYSFRQHCTDRCESEAIRQSQINRTLRCPCQGFDKADSVTQVIYTALYTYLDGLHQLSANDLTQYNLDGFTQAFTEGSFGSVQISKPDVEAFSGLSSLLIRASTDVYRQKKLKTYVAQANAPIQVLLEKLRFILTTNLRGELLFKKERLFAFYTEMLRDTSLSAYEKSQAAMTYYATLARIEAQENELLAFGKVLQVIAKGHQHLYDQRNQLKTKQLRESLVRYASELQDVITRLKKTK